MFLSFLFLRSLSPPSVPLRIALLLLPLGRRLRAVCSVESAVAGATLYTARDDDNNKTRHKHTKDAVSGTYSIQKVL